MNILLELSPSCAGALLGDGTKDRPWAAEEAFRGARFPFCEPGHEPQVLRVRVTEIGPKEVER